MPEDDDSKQILTNQHDIRSLQKSLDRLWMKFDLQTIKFAKLNSFVHKALYIAAGVLIALVAQTFGLIESIKLMLKL